MMGCAVAFKGLDTRLAIIAPFAFAFAFAFGAASAGAAGAGGLTYGGFSK